MNELRNAAKPIMLDPANDDSALLTLERQFNEVAADLFAVQRVRDTMVACSVSRSSESRSELLRPEYSEEVRTRQVGDHLGSTRPDRTSDHGHPRTHDRGIGREGTPCGLCGVPVLGKAG